MGLNLNSTMPFLTEKSFFLWTVVGAYLSPGLSSMVTALFSTNELQGDYERLC